MYPPGQIENRSVQQRGEDVDHVAGGEDGQERLCIVSAVKGEQCEKQRVQNLAD